MKLSVLAPVFLFVSAPCMAASTFDSVTPYISVHSQSFSDISSIKQLIHDLEGEPIARGDFAFTHNQLEVGAESGNWLLSFFHRYDYLMKFTDDTARYMYLKNNDIEIDANESFDILLQANHLRSHGIGIGYKFSFFERLNSKLRVNLLRSSDMTDGDIIGNISTLDTEYSADLELDYVYGKDSILLRPPEKISGQGFSFDFDIEWAVNSDFALRFEGRDILSRMYWDDITWTRAFATTNTISYNDDGMIDLKPAVSGVESYKNHIQKLPARYLINGVYSVSHNADIGIEVFAIDKYLFPRMLAGWNLNGLYLHTSYDFKSKALGVGLKHSYIDFFFKTDDFDLEKACSIEFMLNLNYSF